MSRSKLIRAGALLGAIAVIAGAFGSHALETRLSPTDLAIFETAVRYQLVHALALLAAAALSTPAGRERTGLAGACWTVGSGIFSGSLYLLVLTDTRWLGAITPIGGVLLIAGWLALAWPTRSN